MLSTFVPSFALGYRPMCASDTNALKMAALELETAQLRFQRAQTNYQRTCGSHGLSRDDEFACGQFGHAREEYRHTAKLLDLAKNRFRSSNRSAASSCSVSVEDTPSLRALKKVAPGE